MPNNLKSFTYEERGKRTEGKPSYPDVAYSAPSCLITIFVHVLCWSIFSAAARAQEALFKKEPL